MRFRVPAYVLASSIACSVGLGTVGCAHADSAAERHIVEMRDAIAKLEAEQDRANQRLGLLEVAAADEKAPSDPKPDRRAPSTVRRTVQIGDSDVDIGNDDPNATDARPAIRLQGQGGASRPARGKSAGDARVELVDESTSDAARSSALDPDAKKSYERALELVNAKRYDSALEALAAFLVRWPDHPYAENALYWRGEVYFARGEYHRAAEQFEGVLARYGAGNKAADALLKLGMCHQRLGSNERANEYWGRLRREHPRSDAVKKIPQPNDTRRTDEAKGASRVRGAGPKESR